MGYFSNGSEARNYKEEYCDRCLHDVNQSCPIWAAHVMRNYEECNDKNSILHMLIPMDGLWNGKCKMFVDKGLLSNLALQKYISEQDSE